MSQPESGSLLEAVQTALANLVSQHGIKLEHSGKTWELGSCGTPTDSGYRPGFLILTRPARDGEVDGEDNVAWLALEEDCGQGNVED